MKRYTHANASLHAPEELKRKTAAPAPGAKKNRRSLWMAPVAAALALVILAGALLPRGGQPGALSAYAVAEAVYPEDAPYPDESKYVDPDTGAWDDEGFAEAADGWFEQQRERRRLGSENADELYAFTKTVLPVFLGNNGGENRVCSPLNLYLALGMLAETTAGESRDQVLSLLGEDSLDSLRERSDALWRACYRDDGAVNSLLAGSLWLNEQIGFRTDTLDRLAETYRASSFSGPMGEEGFTQALRDWLNEQTGGLLEGAVEGVELTEQTVLALVTTLYFTARWDWEFSPEDTTAQTFHGAAGEQTVDFMHQEGDSTYYWGERFSAVSKSMAESGGMWLILPDEGTDPEDLLADSQLLEMLQTAWNYEDSYENQKRLIVDLAMPKFDVQSDLDLQQGLKELGVTDVFDPEEADFSPLAESSNGFLLSKAQHAARVMVDEEGCTAAAFTMMGYAGSGPPPDERVEFTLDRPFLFVVVNESRLPLFVGIVNQVG